MRLKSIELSGFKSFARKTELTFDSDITAIVGPNGSGKSNTAEAFRFVLGEQSMKSMRGRKGEDLIWNGSEATPRAGRASVKLVFDNSDRALSLDFDEVALERVVHRDGGNDYLLNGSHVRLRDITELLAQANIGSSGHHIISQGEADRILSASPKDRREMIEDALGLTAFLYKREDAERKLEKSQENMREVEGLRRELAPHLKFLQSQVKKIEEGEHLRAQLQGMYLEYLKREEVYLRLSGDAQKREREEPETEKHEVEKHIERLRAQLAKKGEADASTHELMALEKEGSAARARRETLSRELGRLEGELAAHERMAKDESGTIPAREALSFAHAVVEGLEHALARDFEGIKEAVSAIVHKAREFAAHISKAGAGKAEAVEELLLRKKRLEEELREAQVQEEKVSEAVAKLREQVESEKDASRDAERELFAAMAKRGELEARLTVFHERAQARAREEERFKEEVREAAALLGRAVSEYHLAIVRNEAGKALTEKEITAEERAQQEDRRRKVERLKIKLEQSGAGNAAEVLKEHKETQERDAFLARELEDLARSAESLERLIEELTKTLEVRFTQGIETISAQFEEFFKLLFGGGSAKLSLVKERKTRRGAPEEGEEDMEMEPEEEFEEGIEVAISLPHKRVKGLHMLSGGERALTSIALIFAMSQVNPPPFLILDETDAALDEANSRRYGDMIETLARRSQLILITHNRETMSRAGILYGVTMGSDGVSKLLSVKFEEAVAVAK